MFLRSDTPTLVLSACLVVMLSGQSARCEDVTSVLGNDPGDDSSRSSSIDEPVDGTVDLVSATVRQWSPTVAGSHSTLLRDKLLREEEPTRGLYGFFGYDTWRGYPDGGWANYGLHGGVNAATSLGRFSELTGIGFQMGGSVGVYDFAGTDYRLANQNRSTTQGFVTYGLFHKISADSPFSAAVVQDWMINNTYSVMAEDSTLSQIRTQVGVQANDRNELGVWGAWRVKSDTRNVQFFGPVTWQPHNQLNAYWHHRWPKSAVDTWMWAGVPERNRLAGEGSLGDYIAGAYAVCPLADRLSLYTMVNYMHQSASPGPDAAKEDAWNFSTGLSFYLQPIARSNSIGGRRWLPQLPVANNGLFLVDASQTY